MRVFRYEGRGTRTIRALGVTVEPGHLIPVEDEWIADSFEAQPTYSEVKRKDALAELGVSSVGGGTYELADGRRVKGQADAIAAAQEPEPEPEPEEESEEESEEEPGEAAGSSDEESDEEEPSDEGEDEEPSDEQQEG